MGCAGLCWGLSLCCLVWFSFSSTVLCHFLVRKGLEKLLHLVVFLFIPHESSHLEHTNSGEAKLVLLLVFIPLPSVSCASPLSACRNLWLGRADLEDWAGGKEMGMVIGIGLGLKLCLSSFLEWWTIRGLLLPLTHFFLFSLPLLCYQEALFDPHWFCCQE